VEHLFFVRSLQPDNRNVQVWVIGATGPIRTGSTACGLAYLGQFATLSQHHHTPYEPVPPMQQSAARRGLPWLRQHAANIPARRAAVFFGYTGCWHQIHHGRGVSMFGLWPGLG
jgi:hypothetical protein